MLHSLFCVGQGRKPRRPVFSQRGSFEDTYEVGKLEAKGNNPTAEAHHDSGDIGEYLVIDVVVTDVHVAVDGDGCQAEEGAETSRRTHSGDQFTQ